VLQYSTTIRAGGQQPGSASRAVVSFDWRLAVLAISMFAAAACSDSPLAPSEKIDQIDVERLMPTVVDAAERLAPRIENVSVRERVSYDMQQLETSLAAADAANVRFHTVVISDILTQYVQSMTTVAPDAPDVDAIRLTLHAVSVVVHAGVAFDRGSGP
jgi:hypothetical protein